MSVLSQILSILAESKKGDELPTATNLVGTDWALIWNNTNQRLEKIAVSAIQSTAGWLWIDGSFVEKGAGNTDTANLEDGDVVYFKSIANAGDPLTLVGYTLDNAASPDVITSYTQNQAITT